MKIKKDDNVLVISGKDKGKTGKVRFAFPKDNNLIIEGVNFQKKHSKAKGAVKQAGIIEREAPIPISNVALVCPECNEWTRVGSTIADGRKVRVCKRCGELIS